jgi:hypothetical protein
VTLGILNSGSWKEWNKTIKIVARTTRWVCALCALALLWVAGSAPGSRGSECCADRPSEPQMDDVRLALRRSVEALR